MLPILRADPDPSPVKNIRLQASLLILSIKTKIGKLTKSWALIWSRRDFCFSFMAINTYFVSSKLYAFLVLFGSISRMKEHRVYN